ncbi:hypothetical protein NEF87_002843 [Candidatus Lokiarchaeum ossiferum]|uniref:PD-(D/E)XK endonuclease-like domain-containing protein n=1 Tax=Candidatus Lokiarchaeum ossiferum TaxID=2951803 RepID=A0ABY6HSS6_9ARCH|nr:hypothetical protein NEF87_002843 [Candidatus Lokiarchaeum sp. B-35]
MINRRFQHNGIVYEFKWAKRQDVISKMPSEIGTRLDDFFQMIYQNKIPHDLFNDNKITRCSSFRIKGLKRGVQPQISKEFIEKKLIRHYKWTSEMKNSLDSYVHKILASAQNLFSEYAETDILNFKPGHDEILTNILLTIEEALSIETPVWTRKQQRITDFLPQDKNSFNFSYRRSLTGHIDLILYDFANNNLIIADYKPEGHFLRSLPQVATYGLLMKRILNIPNIKCLSFSKDEAWLYDPLILQEQIEECILLHGNPKLNWRKIVHLL